MSVEARQKEEARATWALGDYHRFAKETVWELGPILVSACGISPGQRVLDVAAGTGNTALRAAAVGARVTASDLTPENFEAGREEARRLGLELEWVEGDAEALPFEDDAFDVVTSSVGAIFAPDQQAVADELIRVTRPEGTIGMINFTPEGLITDFFATLAPYADPPPGDAPPQAWGSEQHVRRLFGDRAELVRSERREYVERSSSAEEYLGLFRDSFGPVARIYRDLSDQPERLAALERDFTAFVTRSNVASTPGRLTLPYEYLLVVARKRSR
jgi:ubiquinone/menaquinone biosynthesis C-methylase UbiE